MPELREYQKEDLNFLKKLNSAGILSEQRTGKTPIAIAYTKIKTSEEDKILILCPPSAIPVWASEFKKWYPEADVVQAYGIRERVKKKIKLWKRILIISYDTLKATATREGYIDEIKAMGNPELVIIDEAHRIQTRQSATNSAVFQFIKAPKRLALSGTPSTNKPYQVFAILRWLYPRVFTSYWKYIEEFYEAEQNTNHDTGHEYTKILRFKNEAKKQEHAEILKKISVQRKRNEVMQWLPEKEYQRILLEPTTQQKQALEYLQKYFEIGDIECEGVLSRILRERQICAHPAILGIKGPSPKMNWIVQRIKDYPEQSIIIFSKFTTFLKELYKEIPETFSKALYIGDTGITARARAAKAFQEGTLKILLANIDAAKEALTLDRAEVTIFADKYPPIGSIQQAEDRFVATTPEKANKQHTIIELCIQDTYEEEIYKLIEIGAEEIDIINNYKKYLKKENNNE